MMNLDVWDGIRFTPELRKAAGEHLKTLEPAAERRGDTNYQPARLFTRAGSGALLTQRVIVANRSEPMLTLIATDFIANDNEAILVVRVNDINVQKRHGDIVSCRPGRRSTDRGEKGYRVFVARFGAAAARGLV